MISGASVALREDMPPFINGEIQTKEEIAEGARRLTTEDPEDTFNHLNSHDFRLYGMANVYTFIDTLLQTWADSDAPAVVARLQKMKRGGSQQDMSGRFINYRANEGVIVGHAEESAEVGRLLGDGSGSFTSPTTAPAALLPRRGPRPPSCSFPCRSRAPCLARKPRIGTRGGGRVHSHR